MINLETGQFKLDGYDLIIHPDLTLPAFKQGDIPFEDLYSNEKGQVSFRFRGKLEMLDAAFQIYFTGQALYDLTVFFDKKYELGQGAPITNWLTKVTGEAPPFEYEWGCLITDDDRGDYDFAMITKHCIVDRAKRNYERF